MRKITAALMAVLLFVMCALPVFGAELSDSDSYSTGVFIPCEYIPSFATVPDFYIPIESVTCMYMFIDVDGNPHRRWYGSVDGAYGWYAVEDGEQTVRPYSLPIDVEDDREMLYKKTSNVYSTETDLGYVGILPPEESKTEIAEIFGLPIKKFLIYSISGVAALCVIIVSASAAVKSNRKKRRYY